MNRSFVRQAVFAVSAAALTLAFLAVPASTPSQAATFTFSDSNCSSFAFDVAAQAVTCVVSSAPICTVTGPTTGTLNTQITLTASCSPAATSWAWTGGNCGGVTTQTCSAVEANPITQQYTVAGTNGSFIGSPSPNHGVVWSNTPPAAPSGCSITASPTSLPVGGGSLALSMNCTSGGAPDPAGYVWTGGFAAGFTGAAPPATVITSSTTFTATASNAGGVSSPASSKSVTVATGGGGGVDTTACTAQGLTPHVMTIPWGASSTIYTSDGGGFGPNDAFVIKFTTSSITSAGGKGYIRAVEYVDSPNPRTGALSTSPCDFTNGVPLVGGGKAAFANDLAPWQWFTLVASKAGFPILQPSTTYYLNIRNASCAGSCNMQFYLVKPSGS